jgi:hypothetical protein
MSKRRTASATLASDYRPSSDIIMANLRTLIADYRDNPEWASWAAWYDTEHAYLMSMLPSVSADSIMQAVSACSSNAGWAGNVIMMRKLAAAYGTIPSDASSVTLAALRVGIVWCKRCKASGTGCDKACSPVRKAWLALHGMLTTLSSEAAHKTTSFHCNLTGCAHGGQECVTIDRWALCAAYGCRHDKDSSASCGRVPTGEEYVRVADCYRTLAAEYGMQGRALQAAIWCAIRGGAA